VASSVASRLVTRAAKSKVVFLGTPEVAALSLGLLMDAAGAEDSPFEVSAVVTQPPRPKGRGKKLTPSPVQETALAKGLSADRIWAPERASEADFLAARNELAPDLCVTVAYGNFLPSKFLAVPRLGTLNIHPSLLPRWRGAAPVPRSIEAGDATVGVSLVYTVLEMDAGPILRQHEETADGDELADSLLSRMMVKGTEMLLDVLPRVLVGEVGFTDAVAQDEAAITHAAKMSRADAEMPWGEAASLLHDRVRAFTGWPGSFGTFTVTDAEGAVLEELQIKILKSQVVEGFTAPSMSDCMHEVLQEKKALVVPCGDGGLRVLEIQVPGKKAAPALTYVNALKGGGKRLFVKH